MIKIFRRIRKQLLSETKFSKYIFYALGEIILVVLGILIALQINNANEAHKQLTKEIEIYKQIQNDLELTLIEVKKDINMHQARLKDGKLVLDSLTNRAGYAPIADLLMTYTFMDYQVYPNSSGYQTLNSIGLDLLTNESVRLAITNLYELEIKRLVAIGKFNPRYDIETIMKPYTEKHLVVNRNASRAHVLEYFGDTVNIATFTIKDYNALLNDEAFFVKANKSLELRIDKIELHQRVIISLNKTIGMIQSEIKRLEN